MDFFDIIVNFFIQKLKSKHTSLKKYTNWDKLSCLSLYIFLSFWGNERRQKPDILHLSHSKIKSNPTNSSEFVPYHLKMNQAKHDANFTIHRATNVITAINYLADKYYPV